MKTLTTLRTLALSATLSTSLLSMANDQARLLRLDGKLLSASGIDGAVVTIMRDGETFRTIDKGLAHFQVELPLGHEYRVAFTRAGAIAKELVFDTRMPKNHVPRKDYTFNFQVTLEDQPAHAEMKYTGPVGKIDFRANENTFWYAHTKSSKLVPATSENDTVAAASPAAPRTRREVAPFVDPTMELAAFVEQQRAEGTVQADPR